MFESERARFEKERSDKLQKLVEARKNLYENDPSKLDLKSNARSESTPLKTLKLPGESRAEVA